MKFKARIGETVYALEVNREGRIFDVVIDGQSHPAALIFSDSSHDVILYRNICYDVVRVAQDGGYQVDVRNHYFDVEVQDPRQKSLRSSQLADGGRRHVQAAMPGRIVKIMVAEGDSVAEGQGLLILEAMKMQNEIKASRAGVVRSLAVQPGQAVDSGQLLLDLE